MSKLEVAVIGAGPTGLVAALALARNGLEVALVAPPPGPLASNLEDKNGRLREGPHLASALPQDRRTTALIGPSVQLLLNLEAWQVCAPHAAPLAAIRMADDRQGLIRAPELLFTAAEIGLESFGANLPNPALLDALRAAARRAPRLTWVETAGVTDIAPAASWVHLALAEGGSVEARLAVAADGRTSKAPAAAGIAIETWDYPQTALVCSFDHSRPHAGTVNELHRQTGPLTTVPLPGRRSALVWVEAPEAARRLASLGNGAFAEALEEALQGVLGSIGPVGPRALHDLGGRRAERMARARVALVGEAAHVVPPIGAQGLNLGLRDAAVLADVLAEARARGEDIGEEAALAAYDRARRADVAARSLSIDLLNRSLIADLVPVDMLRGLAAHAVASFAPLRRALMQEGTGLAGPLPCLMRKGEKVSGKW
jgi:2-octaprenyl-6-methoxyphenol hydroxylase